MDNNIVDRIISGIEKKNYAASISECSELIKQFPDNIKLYEIRSVCYNATGNYDSAIEDLSVVINKLTGTGDDDYLLKLYSKRGKCFIKKQDWFSAINDFISALEINENVSEIHNNLAACLRRINSFDNAFIHASKAIKLNNKFPEAFNNRANINICLGNYEDAISDYTESIRLNPANPKSYFNRGSIYYEIFKDYENAKNDFLKAIELNPGYEDEIYKEYPEIEELINTPDGDLKEEDTFDDFLEENTEEQYTEEEVKEDYAIEEINEPVKEDSIPDGEEISEEEKDSVLKDSESDYDSDKAAEKDEIESLIAKLDEDKTESKDSVKEEISPNEEIVIPEFDFKSMVRDEEPPDDTEMVEEQNSSDMEPVISDDVKNLHNEIIAGPDFKALESEPAPPEEKEIRRPAPYVPTSRKKEKERKSFIKSPLFFIIIFVLFAAIIVLAVLKIKQTGETQIADVIKNQDTVKKETIEEPKDEPPKETKEETKEDKISEEKKAPVSESRNLGYIGNKQIFVLFSEADGYYVQIGSFKERTKAEEKLKLLKKNNVQGSIVEADLKEKGKFYRVRAGAFKSEEEAKQVTLKLE